MWCATLTFRLFRKRASKRTAPQRAENQTGHLIRGHRASGPVAHRRGAQRQKRRRACSRAQYEAHKPVAFRKPRPHAPAIEFDFTYGDRPRGRFPESRGASSRAMRFFRSTAKRTHTAMDWAKWSCAPKIARRIHATRGVNCDPEQVVLQAGTQAALGNLLDLFDPMRDGVAIENPGYDGAMAVFRNRGFRITPLPVCPDTTEAQQDAFASSLYASGAKLTFCTPSNQFPLGMTMPLSMRVRLIKWAAERDGYIFGRRLLPRIPIHRATHTKPAIARHTKSCDI